LVGWLTSRPHGVVVTFSAYIPLSERVVMRSRDGFAFCARTL